MGQEWERMSVCRDVRCHLGVSWNRVLVLKNGFGIRSKPKGNPASFGWFCIRVQLVKRMQKFEQESGGVPFGIGYRSK